jgi:hypothetical protein
MRRRDFISLLGAATAWPLDLTVPIPRLGRADEVIE